MARSSLLAGRVLERRASIGLEFDAGAAAGEALNVEKVVILYSSREPGLSEPGLEVRREVGSMAGFDELLAEHALRLGRAVGHLLARAGGPPGARSGRAALPHLPSAGQHLRAHRRDRRRGPGSRARRGGISRPHLLGRAVHLPLLQPAPPEPDPLAAPLPLSAAQLRQAERQRGRVRGGRLPLAERFGRLRADPDGTPQPALGPLDARQLPASAPHQLRDRL